jgi:hypothetical protein
MKKTSSRLMKKIRAFRRKTKMLPRITQIARMEMRILGFE